MSTKLHNFAQMQLYQPQCCIYDSESDVLKYVTFDTINDILNKNSYLAQGLYLSLFAHPSEDNKAQLIVTLAKSIVQCLSDFSINSDSNKRKERKQSNEYRSFYREFCARQSKI